MCERKRQHVCLVVVFSSYVLNKNDLRKNDGPKEGSCYTSSVHTPSTCITPRTSRFW